MPPSHENPPGSRRGDDRTRRQLRPLSVVFIRSPALVSALRIAKPTFLVGNEGIDGAVPAGRHVSPLSLVRSISTGHLGQGRARSTRAQASRDRRTTVTSHTEVPRQRIVHDLPPSDVVEM